MIWRASCSLHKFFMCPTLFSGCRRMEENQQLLNQRRKKTRRLKKRKRQLNFEKNSEVDKCQLVCKPLKLRRKGNTAPENTTQFLIEDKVEVLPEYVVSPSRSVSPCCSSSSPSVSPSSFEITPSSGSDRSQSLLEEDIAENFDDMYFQRDFEETYDRIREESLMSIPRSELLRQYLALEMKEEDLRMKVKELTAECACKSNPFAVTVNVTCANCGSCARMKSEPCFDVTPPEMRTVEQEDLSSEIEQLRRSNSLLKEENTKLKCSMAAMEIRSC